MSQAILQSGAALPDIQPKVAALLKKYPVRIEGHRGAGHLEPENSLRAFRRAIELGIDGVEFDVWLTKDHIPVVVHGLPGGVIEFANDVKGVISEIDSIALRSYVLNNGETIPTLEEVLDACRDKVHLNIEIKELNEEVIDKVLALLEERNMFDQITFSSFNHYLRERLTRVVFQKKIASQVTFGFLVRVLEPQYPNYENTQPGDSLNLDIRLLEKHREECLIEIRKAEERNIKIKFWFPMEYIDEHIFYEDLLALKVDTIITNMPIGMIEYFGKAVMTRV